MLHFHIKEHNWGSNCSQVSQPVGHITYFLHIYALIKPQCTPHPRFITHQSKHFHLSERYIILNCVFIVCNVHISLQLFAHINKRFD